MNVHPHFHAMLLVKSTYFHGSHYINQAEWTDMWVKAMRLDYYPQVDIRAVKPNPRKTVDENKSKLHGAVLKRSNTALNRPICSPMTILGSGCMKSLPKPIKCVYRHRRRFKGHSQAGWWNYQWRDDSHQWRRFRAVWGHWRTDWVLVHGSVSQICL